MRGLEDELVQKKEVEREMQEYVAELERNKGVPAGEAMAMGNRDEEYDKLKQRFTEVDRYMLSLYDFERFDTSYLAEATPFLKAKPALPLKPAKAAAPADIKGKKDLPAPKAAGAEKKPAPKHVSGGKAPAASPRAQKTPAPKKTKK